MNHGFHGIPTTWPPEGALTMPLRSMHGLEDLFNTTTVLSSRRNAALTSKDGVIGSTIGFCAFLATNCGDQEQTVGALTRLAFFDALSSEYKNVSGIGPCRHNTNVETGNRWSSDPGKGKGSGIV